MALALGEGATATSSLCFLGICSRARRRRARRALHLTSLPGRVCGERHVAAMPRRSNCGVQRRELQRRGGCGTGSRARGRLRDVDDVFPRGFAFLDKPSLTASDGLDKPSDSIAGMWEPHAITLGATPIGAIRPHRPIADLKDPMNPGWMSMRGPGPKSCSRGQNLVTHRKSTVDARNVSSPRTAPETARCSRHVGWK